MNTAKPAAASDIAHVLHPYTDPRAHENEGPFIVTSGSGVTVTDAAGKEYIEGLAGLWCCSLGSSESQRRRASLVSSISRKGVARPSRPCRRSHVSAVIPRARGEDRMRPPASSRTANSRASPAIKTSGTGAASITTAPATNPARPASHHRPRHRQSHSPPSVIATRLATGIGGKSVTAPGQPATVRATNTTTSMPQPIGASATPSKPNGIRR